MEQKRKTASEPWPRHGVPRYAEVLVLARANGWTLIELRDHGGFKITCPDGQCEERIYSTPRNPETRAKYAMRKVRRCPHNRENQGGATVANGHMDQAERLIDAAAKMIRAQEDYDGLGFLADVPASDEEVNELLEAAATLEEQAEQALPEEWRGTTGVEMADGAQQSLANARSQLIPLDRENRSVKQAWERLKTLKRRLTELREKICMGGSGPQMI